VALEAFEVASLEELHQKLEPFLGGTAVADGAVTVEGEAVPPAGESAGGAPTVEALRVRALGALSTP
jgi:hypothetical protein